MTTMEKGEWIIVFVDIWTLWPIFSMLHDAISFVLKAILQWRQMNHNLGKISERLDEWPLLALAT